MCFDMRASLKQERPWRTFLNTWQKERDFNNIDIGKTTKLVIRGYSTVACNYRPMPSVQVARLLQLQVCHLTTLLVNGFNGLRFSCP